MSKSNKEIALQILNENSIGVMATNNNGVPNSRYMTFDYVQSKLYTVALEDSEVVREITEYGGTHILLGYESDGLLETFLEIEGNAATTLNDVVKQQLLEKYPEHADGNFVLIQVTPTRMRIMNKNGKNQEEIQLY
ncbi:pyridoxamine 5'-phosphate oxidase family protein [Solibacillus isronensis]|uniref:pyridoxamine 5'-phosphate oxidase family protein n=1 Tax=Solibacillus isronensis TaxID=412383 RepID=UPI00203BC4F0|nr:pyridoxamine 5'-phosphate oxidase family protein [Solibacillus isronensis]MCM3722797.1 pyridoxamine 5'-phosphate oxidase family protein [Solibacillus isronensis]